MKIEELLTKSYTPISHFNVASIIKGKNGLAYGVNVENHSMKDGICAEGAALSNYFANGYKKEDIEEIIVINNSDIVDENVVVRCFDKNKNEEKYLVKELCVHPFKESNYGGVDA